MRIEYEILEIKSEIERINCELEEVGLLLNSRGELSKVLEMLTQMDNRIRKIESFLEDKKPKSIKDKFLEPIKSNGGKNGKPFSK